MRIEDNRSKHTLDICLGDEVALRHSEHTHLFEGTPQGYFEVDMHCPWWGLDCEQQAALEDIHERASLLIEEAAGVISRRQ